MNVSVIGGDSNGSTTVNDACIDYDQGNTRATLQLMIASGDHVLARHPQTKEKRATCILHTPQNDLIEAISTVITCRIVDETNSATSFALMADETTDFSPQEQLCMCLGYFLPEELAVKEHFPGFATATDLTEASLSAQLLKILQSVGMKITNIVVQCYDSAAVMFGPNSGVQTYIRDAHPAAAYIHCSSHVLDMCLLKVSHVQEIRAAVTLVKEIAKLFANSHKRLPDSQNFIKLECLKSSHSR